VISGSVAAAVVPPARRTSSSLRLILLVLEGYAYLLLIVAVFCGVPALLAWGVLQRQPLVAIAATFVGLPAIILTGSALRALVFRVSEAGGRELTRSAAPELFRLIDEVSRKIGGPRVDRVIVDSALNASAVQAGRIGIFWPTNVLRLGYPLLLTLSPAQLRAVVAHELAHLFHAHGRVSGLVYRTRLSWSRLAAALAERQTVPIFVRCVFWFYLPRLAAHSAALSRDQELLADRYAAAIAGSRNAAEALIASEVGKELLRDKFWPAMFAEVESRSEPPRPFTELRTTQALRDEGDRRRVLDDLLQATTADHDTHPSLSDRLRAFGERAEVPDRPERSAAEVCLGPLLDDIAAALDDEWQREHGAGWRERHARVRDAKARLAKLDEEGDRSADAMFRRGEVLEELGEDAAALEMYQRGVELGGNDARALLAAGRLCLERGDRSGIALLERAMTADEDVTPAASALLIDHYEANGTFAQAQSARTRARRYETRAAIIDKERHSLTALDNFTAHGLSSEQLRPLVATLEMVGGACDAFLVAKKLRHSAGELTALCLAARGVDATALAEQVRSAGHLPAGSQIVVLTRDQDPLRLALEAVPGAHIYRRR
jgi:Zn-dependent protease with chaperone function